MMCLTRVKGKGMVAYESKNENENKDIDFVPAYVIWCFSGVITVGV